MNRTRWRGLAALIAAAGALALSACLLTPGRFTSALDLRKDGRFSFSYAGEIRMLALSKLAEKQASEGAEFVETPCHDDDLKDRPCTKAELAEQKRAWEESQKSAAERKAREAEQMKAFLGGIDPSSPQAAEELAARLRRQAGWKSVVYKGDGLFVVDFSLAGRLDHDFTFPTIERFPMANAFVQLSRRADGSVRVDAPGYAASSGAGNPFAAMMSGMGGGDGAKDKDQAAALPFEGTFTITTDAAILANNTDEGPQADPAGKRLVWAVNARVPAAPTALLKLGS